MICDECGATIIALGSDGGCQECSKSMLLTTSTGPKPAANYLQVGPDVEQLISEECEKLKELLISKNRKYGNSALMPKRICSKADPLEQIKVRMDDKLSRIDSQQIDDDEDAYTDLAGYIILMNVYKRMNEGLAPHWSNVTWTTNVDKDAELVYWDMQYDKGTVPDEGSDIGRRDGNTTPSSNKSNK